MSAAHMSERLVLRVAQGETTNLLDDGNTPGNCSVST